MVIMKYRKIFLRFFVNIISDEMLQNLKNFKILFKNYRMRNFRIFQNTLVWEILREDVNFLNISEYFEKIPIRIKIIRKIIRKIFTRDISEKGNNFQIT